MVAVALTEEDQEESSSSEGEEVSKKQKIVNEVSNVLDFAFFSVCVYIAFISIFGRSIIHPLSPPLSESSEVENVINSTTISPETPLSASVDLGSSTATVLAILVTGLALGRMLEWATLPPLLGMLIAGILLRNLPIPGLESLVVPQRWSTVLRRLAFVVILLRGGLSLDGKALKKMKGACLRLALSPCTVEALAVSLAAKVVFGLDFLFGLLLGFILAAVSPAVVVPSMIWINERGYGQQSGVTSLVVAAASLDDVYAITLFSVVLSIIFSTGDSIWLTLIRAPLEVIGGCLLGVVYGFALRFARPHWRLLLLCTSAAAFFFLCTVNGLDAAGALSALVAAFVAGEKWKQKESPLSAEVSLGIMWRAVFQPLLFGLIGFELSFKLVSFRLLALGLIVLAFGVAVRTGVAFLATICSGLSSKERLFVALAWIPKATVQAALAPVALDLCVRNEAEGKLPDEYRDASTVVFALAVLAILTTAPIGAALIRLTASRLLQREEKSASCIVETASVNSGDNVELMPVEDRRHSKAE